MDERLKGYRSRKEKKPLEEQLSSGSDQLVCHKTKERIQKKARKFGWRFATKHLDGLNWEVMVVDSYTSNACYIPNGKIVIFTGLVNKLKSDAEVAAVLGHEVGHGIARHITENLFRILWVLISLILCPLPDEIGPQFHPINFLLFFISRRREMEADYIGMMLMASVGYDPRVAPGVELKIDDSDHHNVFSTHPCGRKRAKKLENAEVMDQAMAIYKDRTGAIRTVYTTRETDERHHVTLASIDEAQAITFSSDIECKHKRLHSRLMSNTMFEQDRIS
ncbi:mitochondrial metalloendopeptidase OMA1-like [Rhododendron vialii]|uniref:mitochondrial metalloendopeptidase OMA1-like n=1 Tax=Rhododendron vialii TaxID=182163 RepID=UPI00265EDCEC|nr:mitochondrial metalloendopeptidase OMA1-like [Rhododendron vialii]